MLKKISNLGKVLDKTEQKTINGSGNDLYECLTSGGPIISSFYLSSGTNYQGSIIINCVPYTEKMTPTKGDYTMAGN